MNENQPVTRLELIDAIAKLHVINDRSLQLRKSLNNSETRCCNRLRQLGENAGCTDV